MVTDEWWLDIVEIKEGEFLFPNLNHDWRWIFPLPHQNEEDALDRGQNLAWTALQLDWAREADEKKICQLTHPRTVRAFMNEWPGLNEYARAHPAILALYAPQLTLPGYDDGLGDVFDELLKPESYNETEAFRYDNHGETVDGKKPLCGDFISWRHPTFGNFTPGELAYQFVNAHGGSYSRSVFDGFSCLLWLLSNDSDWMPSTLKSALLAGFRERVSWWLSRRSTGTDMDEVFGMLFKTPKSRFRYAKNIKKLILQSCEEVVSVLQINDDAERLSREFINCDFLLGYYEENKRIQETRRQKASSR